MLPRLESAQRSCNRESKEHKAIAKNALNVFTQFTEAKRFKNIKCFSRKLHRIESY